VSDWLAAGAAYACDWLAFQLRLTGAPGAVMAIVDRSGRLIEWASGLADFSAADAAMTARHRFRFASLSKTFTAVGVLKLAAAGRLALDEPVGKHVADLHPDVAAASLRQLLSHTAGLSRDGDDGGYFGDVRPFPDRDRVKAELAAAPVIGRGQRFKYSNYGYALLGLTIEAVTGEAYDSWSARELIAASGLEETTPDALQQGDPLVTGYSGILPLGRRVAVPGRQATRAFSPVAGLAATAADMARFYARLDPRSADGVIPPALRREMARPLAPDIESASGRSYGLGVHCGRLAGWRYFGHVGRFQGQVTRVVVAPSVGLTVVLAVNAIDAATVAWTDGVLHILRRFHDEGAPAPDLADWSGRWWNLWGATDFVAVGERVLAFNPAAFPPFAEASEISPREGQVVRAPAMERFGEPVQRLRKPDGRLAAIRVGGALHVSERACAAAMENRYEAAS
jgi:D-alanyl-D-alanine carboxypeptidase